VLSGHLCVLSAGCWCSTTSWRSDWQGSHGSRMGHGQVTRLLG
jgi:hypothetical protein